jgi:hypothetical protein
LAQDKGRRNREIEGVCRRHPGTAFHCAAWRRRSRQRSRGRCQYRFISEARPIDRTAAKFPARRTPRLPSRNSKCWKAGKTEVSNNEGTGTCGGPA